MVVEASAELSNFLLLNPKRVPAALRYAAFASDWAMVLAWITVAKGGLSTAHKYGESSHQAARLRPVCRARYWRPGCCKVNRLDVAGALNSP